MNFKRRNEKGITLVALVVTIIVLIILAGVSINLLVGQDGLISRAKLAKEQYENAALDEQNKLNELYERLAGNWSEEEEEENNQLPVLTADTEAGTIVKLPDEWATETARYVSTNTGVEITEVTKVASVYAVAIGGGESVPVPYGFYYVGGNLATGVVISDAEADKNKYVNDENKDVGIDLVGNQFVWIPCSTNAYVKTDWGKQNANWDNTTPKAELSQIEKYSGFYVGRYEAGLASDMTEFTTNQTHTGSNQVYNQYKTPQSKAGLVPWNFVDWTHSKANAESMYNNNYVSSGLITGTQWDVILNTMKSKAGLSDSDITNSNSWGNYKNKQLTFTGRKAVASHNGSNWILAPFGTQTTDGTKGTYSGNGGELLTTGASATTQKYHIFDIAGNLWEWTEEDSHYQTSGQYRVLRGGDYLYSSSDYPACYRYGTCSVSHTSLDIGFRAVLYIK